MHDLSAPSLAALELPGSGCDVPARAIYATLCALNFSHSSLLISPNDQPTEHLWIMSDECGGGESVEHQQNIQHDIQQWLEVACRKVQAHIKNLSVRRGRRGWRVDFDTKEIAKSVREEMERAVVAITQDVNIDGSRPRKPQRAAYFATLTAVERDIADEIKQAIHWESIIDATKIPPGMSLIKDFISQDEQDNINAVFDQKWDIFKLRHVQHYGHRFIYHNNSSNSIAVGEHNSSIPKQLAEIGRRLAFIHTQWPREGVFDPDQLTVNKYEPGHGIPHHTDSHNQFGDVVVSISLLGDTVMDFRPALSQVELSRIRRCKLRDKQQPKQSILCQKCLSNGKLRSLANPECSYVLCKACCSAKGHGRNCGHHLSRYTSEKVSNKMPTADTIHSFVLPARSALILTGEARYAWTHSIAPRKSDWIAGQLSLRKTRISLTYRMASELPCQCAFPDHCEARLDKVEAP